MSPDSTRFNRIQPDSHSSGRPKRSLLSVVGTACIALSFLLLVAAYALPRFFVEQGSLLELSPQALTTGQVYGGQKVPFEFRLINKSGAPITDIRIRSTCSCQGVVLDKTSIGSGEIAVVSGTLISPNKAGVFEQRIIVQYRAQTPKYGERNLGTIWTIEGVTTESVVSRNTGEKWSRP